MYVGDIMIVPGFFMQKKKMNESKYRATKRKNIYIVATFY